MTTARASGKRWLLATSAALVVAWSEMAATADHHSLSMGMIRAVPISGVALSNPMALAVDRSGNIFVADTLNNVIRKVDAGGGVSIVAGNGRARYSGDNGPATSASLNHPGGVAVDAAGNLYINDENNFVVRKISVGQVISTVAGTGKPGYSGDGGPATKAQIAGALGVAVDAAGNLYIADTGNCVIRKVTRKGIISTVAGDGQAAYGGDGGPATLASLRYPTDVALDAAGDLYIADYFNGMVRKVDRVSQFISTVAGNGLQTYSGDTQPARTAGLHGPVRIAFDSAGNLYIETDGDGRIRQVNTEHIINTIAGNGAFGDSGDGGPAALASLRAPYGMSIDKRDALYIADTGNNRVRMITGVGFPIKVPLSNLAPGPKLLNDFEVGVFSSAEGVADWYFDLSAGAAVAFHFTADGTAGICLHRTGKSCKAIGDSSTMSLTAGSYYVESNGAGRATVTPRSEPTQSPVKPKSSQ